MANEIGGAIYGVMKSKTGRLKYPLQILLSEARGIARLSLARASKKSARENKQRKRAALAISYGEAREYFIRSHRKCRREKRMLSFFGGIIAKS